MESETIKAENSLTSLSQIYGEDSDSESSPSSPAEAGSNANHIKENDNDHDQQKLDEQKLGSNDAQKTEENDREEEEQVKAQEASSQEAGSNTNFVEDRKLDEQEQEMNEQKTEPDEEQMQAQEASSTSTPEVEDNNNANEEEQKLNGQQEMDEQKMEPEEELEEEQMETQEPVQQDEDMADVSCEQTPSPEALVNGHKTDEDEQQDQQSTTKAATNARAAKNCQNSPPPVENLVKLLQCVLTQTQILDCIHMPQFNQIVQDCFVRVRMVDSEVQEENMEGKHMLAKIYKIMELEEIEYLNGIFHRKKLSLSHPDVSSIFEVKLDDVSNDEPTGDEFGCWVNCKIVQKRNQLPTDKVTKSKSDKLKQFMKEANKAINRDKQRAINEQNISLFESQTKLTSREEMLRIFLRRSQIVELFQSQPENFHKIVIGCFVRFYYNISDGTTGSRGEQQYRIIQIVGVQRCDKAPYLVANLLVDKFLKLEWPIPNPTDQLANRIILAKISSLSDAQPSEEEFDNWLETKKAVDFNAIPSIRFVYSKADQVEAGFRHEEEDKVEASAENKPAADEITAPLLERTADENITAPPPPLEQAADGITPPLLEQTVEEEIATQPEKSPNENSLTQEKKTIRFNNNNNKKSQPFKKGGNRKGTANAVVKTENMEITTEGGGSAQNDEEEKNKKKEKVKVVKVKEEKEADKEEGASATPKSVQEGNEEKQESARTKRAAGKKAQEANKVLLAARPHNQQPKVMSALAKKDREVLKLNKFCPPNKFCVGIDKEEYAELFKECSIEMMRKKKGTAAKQHKKASAAKALEGSEERGMGEAAVEISPEKADEGIGSVPAKRGASAISWDNLQPSTSKSADPPENKKRRIDDDAFHDNGGSGGHSMLLGGGNMFYPMKALAFAHEYNTQIVGAMGSNQMIMQHQQQQRYPPPMIQIVQTNPQALQPTPMTPPRPSAPFLVVTNNYNNNTDSGVDSPNPAPVEERGETSGGGGTGTAEVRNGKPITLSAMFGPAPPPASNGPTGMNEEEQQEEEEEQREEMMMDATCEEGYAQEVIL